MKDIKVSDMEKILSQAFNVEQTQSHKSVLASMSFEEAAEEEAGQLYYFVDSSIIELYAEECISADDKIELINNINASIWNKYPKDRVMNKICHELETIVNSITEKGNKLIGEVGNTDYEIINGITDPNILNTYRKEFEKELLSQPSEDERDWSEYRIWDRYDDEDEDDDEDILNRYKLNNLIRTDED